MKRMFKMLVVMLAIVSATSAQAQTKEFLEKFNDVKRLVETPGSIYTDIEVAQYPADMLLAMGVSDPINGRNVLNNLDVIYQVKIPCNHKRYAGTSIYNKFVNLQHEGSKLYEQIVCQSSNGKEFGIYKVKKVKEARQKEFMILVRDKNKAVVFDLVGNIDIKDVMTMLSPELKAFAKVDSLSISNK